MNAIQIARNISSNDTRHHILKQYKCLYKFCSVYRCHSWFTLCITSGAETFYKQSKVILSSTSITSSSNNLIYKVPAKMQKRDIKSISINLIKEAIEPETVLFQLINFNKQIKCLINSRKYNPVVYIFF